MRHLLATLALLASLPAFAAPFAVGDVTCPNCDRCVWDGTGFGPLVNNVVVDAVRGKPAFGNRVCLRDVAGALVGTNNITLSSRISTATVWGDSATVPFAFVRPAPPTVPEDMRVMP